MIFALLVLAVLAVSVAFLSNDSKKNGPLSEPRQQVWASAVSNERSAVGRILLNVARPLSRTSLIQREAATPQWRSLQRKLNASGTFNGDVEVFLAVQVACGMIALLAIAAAVASSDSSLNLVTGLLFGAAIAAYPWNIVSKSATKRTSAVLDNLPDFAELLQMPLSAGMGIPPALKFTAERLPGPVSDEVHRMLDQIRVNPTEESAIFIATGERLGVPEARSFFTALLQSHVEGASVSANLSRQAEILRAAAYQRRRSMLKRLPIKLVLIIGMHFLPLLFILGLLPTFLSLGNF